MRADPDLGDRMPRAGIRARRQTTSRAISAHDNASPAQILATSGPSPAATRRRSRASRSPAPSRHCRPPSASAPRRRRRSPRRRWPRPRSGGSAAGAARPSPSTCATRPSSSAASATCASPTSRRPRRGTRSPASTAPAMAAACACTPTFPHHRDGMLKLLGCAYDREAVQAALAKWEGEKFETAAAEARLVATMMRSPRRMGGAPAGQGRRAAAAVRDHQDRRGPGPSAAARRRAAAVGHPRARSDARHRRAGVRTHAGRARRRRHAHHGAAPAGPARARHRYGPRQARRPRSTCAPARSASGWPALLREAHVFVQGYRPGGLAALGFSPEACAEIGPASSR